MSERLPSEVDVVVVVVVVVRRPVSSQPRLTVAEQRMTSFASSTQRYE
jgi:hypothetical protein